MIEASFTRSTLFLRTKNVTRLKPHICMGVAAPHLASPRRVKGPRASTSHYGDSTCNYNQRNLAFEFKLRLSAVSLYSSGSSPSSMALSIIITIKHPRRYPKRVNSRRFRYLRRVRFFPLQLINPPVNRMWRKKKRFLNRSLASGRAEILVSPKFVLPKKSSQCPTAPEPYRRVALPTLNLTT